jgi:hypothetical protein
VLAWLGLFWFRSLRPICQGMTHRTLSAELVGEPAPVVAVERRCAPSRRVGWRGGRRDTDWLNRPPGVLTRVTQRHVPLFAWRTWLGRPAAAIGVGPRFRLTSLWGSRL